MLQSILDSSTIPLLEQLAIFGERRQEVLAGNITNLSTPGYKTRDLPVEEFQAALKEAIDNRQKLPSPGASNSRVSNNPKSTAEFFSADLFIAKQKKPENITFQDGNNRSVEHAQMEMLKNTMMQNFAVELMRAQFSMLQTAISGRL